jgi:hypothetical protein
MGSPGSIRFAEDHLDTVAGKFAQAGFAAA